MVIKVSFAPTYRQAGLQGLTRFVVCTRDFVPGYCLTRFQRYSFALLVTPTTNTSACEMASFLAMTVFF